MVNISRKTSVQQIYTREDKRKPLDINNLPDWLISDEPVDRLIVRDDEDKEKKI